MTTSARPLNAAQRAVTLRLPFPPRELNPNRSRRLHWAKAALARSIYRMACRYEAYDQTRERLKPPVNAKLLFVVPDRRRRDADNFFASLKPMWDGLVDAGILADDSNDALHIKEYEMRYEKGQRYIEVTLSGAVEEALAP